MGETLSHLVAASGLTKRYLGLPVVDDVSFSVGRGEVIGLLGKNGAGKSTVIKMLSGGVRPDAGQIEIMGTKVPNNHSTSTANRLGLATMHQELEAAPTMSIAENVLLGSRYPRRLKMFVDWGEAGRSVSQLLDYLDVGASPSSLMGDLSLAQQRMVMIARALHHRAQTLILDEPTASLSDEEVERLFRVIRDLKSSGRSIIYVSHRLGEVFAVTDRVLVMRDGRIVHRGETVALTQRSLIAAITGEDLPDVPQARHRTAAVAESPVLSVKALAAPGSLSPVTFDLLRGEILGVAGLVGAGRTELARMICGADPIGSGEIELGGKKLKARSPRAAIKSGIVLLPEDRRNQGLLLSTTVRSNVTLATLSKHRRLGPFVSKASEDRAVRRRIAQLDIRPGDPDHAARLLSGGNQQKVVLARWFEATPKVLVLDEPTQGIDIHAKAEVFALIHQAAADGTGVILISSDFAELVEHCDRVIVMRESRLVGELRGARITDAEILRLAYEEYETVKNGNHSQPAHVES